jgi:hypothetical protein
MEAKRKALDALAAGAKIGGYDTNAARNPPELRRRCRKCLKVMAQTTRLEPAASAVAVLSGGRQAATVNKLE